MSSAAYEVSLRFQADVNQAQVGIGEILKGIRGLQDSMSTINKEMVAQSKAVQQTLVTMSEDLKVAGSQGKNTLSELAAGAVLGDMAMRGLAMATHTVVSALRMVIGEGIRYNSVMEGAELGIASLISAQTQLRDANGNLLEGQEALTAAQGLAASQMRALKIAGLETTATTEELVFAFQGAIAPGLQVGLTLDQIRKFAISMSQAAGAMQMPMNQLGEEVRSLLNGNIEPRNTRIASALGITNEKIKELKAQGPGELYRYLEGRLEAFGVAGEKAAQSWSGLTSNLVEAGQTMAGEMGKPLFDSLKGGLQKALADAFDLKNASISQDFAGLVDLGQMLSQTLGDLALNALVELVDQLKTLSRWTDTNHEAIARTLAVSASLASTLGGLLADSLRLVVEVGAGAMRLLGDMPVPMTAVAGAVLGLAAANAAGATTFTALGTSALAAAGAVKVFFASIGPVGWAVAALGALAGAVMAVRASREGDTKAAEANTQAMAHAVNETGGLVRRYRELKDSIDSGRLSVAERHRAETEMATLLERISKLDAGYAQIIQGETSNRDALCKKLWEESQAREANLAKKREELKLEQARLQASAKEQEIRLRRMEQGRLPDTGAEASAASQQSMAQGWYSRELDEHKKTEAALESVNTQLRALGGETSAMTLDRAKTRMKELREAIAQADKEIKAIGEAGGGEAETKAYRDRLLSRQAMKDELKNLLAQFPEDVTVTNRGGAPGPKKDKTDPYLAIGNQLERDRLKTLEQQTLEQERQVAVAEAFRALREQLEQIETASTKAKKDGTFSQAKDHELRVKAVQLYWAQVEKVDREMAQKRIDLEEKVTGALTAAEEGGLAKRLEVIRKRFEKLRAENDRLSADGKAFLTDDQIISAESAEKAKARLDQVRADLGELNRQLAELAQQKGRALTDKEVTGVMSSFGQNDPAGTRSQAIGQKRQELGMDQSGMQGWIAGVDTYLAKSQNAFQSWKDVATGVLSGVEGSAANFFQSFTQHGTTASQKWDALWKGMTNATTQALSKMAAQEMMEWGIKKAKLAWKQMEAAWTAANTATEIGQSGARAAAAASETGPNVANAAAKTFSAHASIPWVGIAAAAAMVALMVATMGSIKARAVGGLVTKPEVTLLGEAGPELVAPESDFKDWANNLVIQGAYLQSNLQNHQGQVNSYHLQAAAYADDARRQQLDREASGGGPGASRLLVLQNPVFLGDSMSSMREASRWFDRVEDFRGSMRG